MSCYFIRRNQLILGPFTRLQALEYLTTGRLLDSDEISGMVEGPWSRAVPTLQRLATIPTGSFNLEVEGQAKEIPPNVPQEPPPFKVDVDNEIFALENSEKSITSSFDDWVKQDVSDVPPARFSGWIAPLEPGGKPVSASDPLSIPKTKSGSTSWILSSQKNSLIYLGIGISIGCLATMAVGMLVGSILGANKPKGISSIRANKSSEPQSILNIRNLEHGSFDFNHGKANVYADPMGNHNIIIECQSGGVVYATWRPAINRSMGFEIISIHATKLDNEMASLMIAREAITQYTQIQNGK